MSARVLCVAVLLLAGWLSPAAQTRAQPAPTPTPQAVSCPSGVTPDGLWIRRLPARTSGWGNAGPLDRVLLGAPVVEQLYAIVCAAQPAGNSPVHCPPDSGVFYGLDFAYRDTDLIRAWVVVGGCSRMTFGDTPYLSSLTKYYYSPALWPLLARALGVPERKLYPYPIGVGPPIKVSAHVDQIDYPDHALARVTIRIRNISKHVVRLDTGCPLGNPIAEVEKGDGRIVYPAGLSQDDFPPACGPAFGPAILPGGTLVRHRYVVLDGRWFAVTVVFGQYDEVMGTGADSVGWGLGKAPSISLQLHPHLVVRVIPRRPQHGRLFYSDSYRCLTRAGKPLAGGTAPHWRTVAGTTITPALSPRCRKVVAFQITAGWLNQPVARASYSG